MRRILATTLGIGFATVACADEGMWQPAQLPSVARQMTARGFKLDPNSLTDLTGDVMGAVVSLGGCTASFVSPEGLVVTNHHCAYGALQYNSTPQRNLIKEGVLAKLKADETPGDPNQRVYVTEEIRDVTAQVNAGLKPGMRGLDRYQAIDAAKKSLVTACEKPGYHCDVYTFHGGYSFQLVRQLEIKDVRVVYAPPDSIGKFGGDVDNWMWPRHTGDFAFLRAYVAPDGTTATYAKENVPYRPKHWLKLNPQGLQAGDFAMVVGYPGRTYRYRLNEELDDALSWQYPTQIATNADELRIIADAGAKDPAVAVKYASIVASRKNASKKYQGILEGMSRGDAVAARKVREDELTAWLAKQGKPQAAQLKDLGALRQLLAGQRATRERDLLLTLLPRLGAYNAAYTTYRLSLEHAKPDAQREYAFQERDEVKLEGTLKQLERRMDAAVDQQHFAYLLNRYAKLSKSERLPALDAWLGLDRGAVDAAAINDKVAALYRGSKFADTAERLRWFKSERKQLEASSDTWLVLMVKLMPDLLRVERESKDRQGREFALRPSYMQAMIAFNSQRGVPVFPDANSSLRVTFGSVKGYSPRDGVDYAPFTTARGVIDKSNGVEPFNTPAAALAALRSRDYGRYASPQLNNLPVDFLTDLDITGGNSGSPTLDAQGRLVGLAFDTNWESVSSDWIFSPQVTRTIHVDVRYMLWVMDKFDHAENVLRELGLGR